MNYLEFTFTLTLIIVYLNCENGSSRVLWMVSGYSFFMRFQIEPFLKGKFFVVEFYKIPLHVPLENP